jgi:mannan endo-1,4-beta-mannosidase
MKNHKFIRNQLFAVIAATSFANIAYADWSIAGNKILDPNGNPFVYRGINLAEKPTTANMTTLFRDVAATGANAIRIPVYSSAPSVETLHKYIQLCRENKLVCVLTNMGSTGYGDLTNSSSLVGTSLTWLDSRIKPLLNENADFVIINLANEPAGNDFPSSLYLADMKQTIALVRQLGLKNQIMIEAGGWGQDWQFTMRDNAEQIMAADPLKNLVFSVHRYEAYNDPVVIRNYLTSFTARNLPIVVGEFAPKRKYRDGEWKNPFGNSIEVAEDSIMEIAQELGVGYLGWAWAGNRIGFTDLDMVVNWNPLQLTPWGDFFINSANGIKATSKLATHYSNSNVPPIANFTVSASSGCMEGKLLLSAQGSYDPDGDQLSYEWSNGARGYSTELTVASGTSVSATLKVTDATGMSASFTRDLGLWFFDSCSSHSSSSSSVPVKSSSSIATFSSSSSSSIRPSSSSSSIRPSSSSSSIRPSSASSSSRSSSSSLATTAACSYVVNSQWSNGFTAAIRIKNTGAQVINGWDVNWQYSDGSKITNQWNASLTGSNPYNAKNLSWNSSIQPGQTIEFGFQGSKSAAAAVVPIVRGAVCQ